MVKHQKTDFSASTLALLEVASIPTGALAGGVLGIIGKFSLSFFNPALASAAGTFGTFAGVGAIVGPLVVIPNFLKIHFFDNSSVLKNHPILKELLSNIFSTLISVGSTVSAALILGLPPFGATVIASLAIPVVCCALSSLLICISDCLNYAEPEIIEPYWAR